MHESVKCVACHLKPVFSNVGKNCADCHADIHRRQMGPDCAQCHTVQGWNIAVQQVKDHQNRFPLLGAHAAVQCNECHKQLAAGIFYGLSTQCDSCHLKDWQNTTNPPHATAGPAFASANCQGCHNFDTFLNAKFDHSTTGFPLTAGHANVPCTSCHINNNYNLQIAPNDCGNSGCHLSTWQQTNNPPHPKAGPAFAAANCSQCHTTTSWTTATFDHSTTGFLLTNGHANVPCAQCHVNNNYNLQIAPNDCGNSGCHLTTWQQTNNPKHSTSGSAFAVQNCATCHTTVGWDSASFDHSTTGFALTGVHATTPCAQCHVNNNYSLTSADCYGCHTADWNKTQTLGGNVPNHVSAGFPTSQCAQCHDTTSWANSTFNHATTGFPLTNSHQLSPAGKVSSCAQCHVNNNYSLSIAPTDCANAGCHLTTWQQTNNPKHSAAGPAFAAANCSTCHDTIAWTDTTGFNHASTGWALTGVHTTTPCASCHTNNNYTLTQANTDCYGCHTTDWNKTQTLGGNVPNHVSAGFPTSQCSQCHDTTSWADATFNHSTTGFPLTNSHQLAPAGKVANCAQCHVNNNYALNIAPTDCANAGCHLTTWQQTNNPTHSAAGPAFAAANCSTCHDTIAWTDVTGFNHASTGFALTGVHATTPCAQCHVNNNYSLTSTDCYGCHTADWNKTQTLGGNVPNHVSAGFPTSQCSQCHDTTTWADSTFNHATTGFPLTNSHQLAPAGKVTSCAQCHVNNNYSLNIAPTDCANAGCHLTTWQQTNNPTHSAAGPAFAAANCSTCHDTIAWTDVTGFNHASTGWALTGVHATTPCASCHTNNNYTLTQANTDCYGCHTSDWNSTQTLGGNVPNHVTAGFPTSQCSTCHDTTNWADGKFDHTTTGFPLTNSHQMAPAGKVTACAQCHVNNNYTLNIAPTDCGNAGCHLTTWQQTNNPTHSAAGSAFAVAQCSTCHDTTLWTNSTFNHAVTGWALTGVHATTPCANCHTNNNYNFTSANTDCYGCHTADWNKTQTLGGNVPNHVTAGFPTSQCSTCHDTTNWADSTFDHTTTGFPLTGQHAVPPLQCAQCHTNGNYNLKIAPTDCANAGCHQTDWQNTNNPVHSSAGTTFAAANCANCHSTANPFTTTSWNHSSTGWALAGNHQMSPAGVVTNCNQCHVGNNYNLTVTDCYNSGCHTTDWNSTATLGGAVPNHVAAQFPTSMCATCHDTINWADGKFDHSTTGWALTGGHVVPTAGGVQACTDCHVNNNYSLTSANTACYGCHTAEWNSTQTLGGSVPNHIAAGYPTTCDTCHTTTSWLGATFDHSNYFPIPHHESNPPPCNDCHQVSTDYSNFTCINCHSKTAHQQADTVDEHNGVKNFVYGPETCYNCHKNGGGG